MMEVLVEEKEDEVAFEDEVDKALTDQRWNVTTAMDQDITNMSVLEGRMTEQIMQNEEMLLMAQVDDKKVEKKNIWFLDSRRSNHMCRKKELSYHIDENFRQTVKLGDNLSMAVMSKGNVKFKVNEIVQVITEVFMYQT